MTETSSYNMTDELRIIEFAIKKEKKKNWGVESFLVLQGNGIWRNGHATGETKPEHQRKKGVNKTNPTKTLPIE